MASWTVTAQESQLSCLPQETATGATRTRRASTLSGEAGRHAVVRARPLESGGLGSRGRVGALRKAWLSSAAWSGVWNRLCRWQEGMMAPFWPGGGRQPQTAPWGCHPAMEANSVDRGRGCLGDLNEKLIRGLCICLPLTPLSRPQAGGSVRELELAPKLDAAQGGRQHLWEAFSNGGTQSSCLCAFAPAAMRGRKHKGRSPRHPE